MGAGYASDISYLEAATRRIALVATSSKIVIEKSTVPCKTAESMRAILDANSSPDIKFSILSNPEFLAEGTAVKDLFNPDRVLIGSLETPDGLKARATLASVYAHWVPEDRIITANLWSSELTKLVYCYYLINVRLLMPCLPSVFLQLIPLLQFVKLLEQMSMRLLMLVV